MLLISHHLPGKKEILPVDLEHVQLHETYQINSRRKKVANFANRNFSDAHLVCLGNILFCDVQISYVYCYIPVFDLLLDHLSNELLLEVEVSVSKYN